MAKNKNTATAPKKTTPNANTSTGDTLQSVVGAGTVETNTNPDPNVTGAGSQELGTGNVGANNTPNATGAGKTDDKETEEPKVSDAVAKIGKNLLKSNPAMAVVFMTSDGRGFYEKNDADNHARTLKNKAVTPIKK